MIPRNKGKIGVAIRLKFGLKTDKNAKITFSWKTSLKH